MRQLLVLVMVIAGWTSWSMAQQAGAPAPAAQSAGPTPVIDIVFCIDCSGSMGPVIDTAKLKVWAIVNEVAKLKPTPVLRIGLYGYGNANGPFRKFELMDDLDEVYKNLMTFRDEGWSEEYVGLVIKKATEEMKWTDGGKVMKTIYVVGNETARQGGVDYTQSAPAAIAKGIVINAIYCGTTEYATATPTWREIAKLADGQYMEIADSGGAIVVSTPYDDALVQLNTKLNGTYIGYGARGAAGLGNQMAQDSNAVSAGRGGGRGGAGGGAVLADRAVAKSQSVYRNGSWDLVDASKEANFDLAKIPEDQLPEELKKLPADQREKYIEDKSKDRAEIQAQIKDLAGKREKAVQEQIQKQGLAKDGALDEAVKASIVNQARNVGFEVTSEK